MSKAAVLRTELVRVALAWEEYFGVAPQITNAISELDAALLVGMSEEEYCADCSVHTAVTRGKDFTHRGVRYQITANRPSGKKGSKVTLVSLKRKFEWDRLVWILYDRHYVLQEAWEFTVEDYRNRFGNANINWRFPSPRAPTGDSRPRLNARDKSTKAQQAGVKLGVRFRRRIDMSVTLTKHEIARSRDEPVIGTRGPIIQYRVGGLPPEERAFIANFGGSLYEESWRIFHTKKGIDALWNGDYKTADDALAALQNEY